MRLADLLVVMNGGRMEQVGTALEVFQKPASTFVAGFIGSPPMNFLTATVEAPGRLRLPDGASLAYDPASAAAPAGAKVLAGLRPETVALGTGTDASSPRFKIELIEELGMGRLVHGRVGDSAFTVAQGPAEPRPQADAFTLQVAPGAIHVFDAASGARL
jgi:sn-glycerol 3-phosphate transport system ATP-binding protein